MNFYLFLIAIIETILIVVIVVVAVVHAHLHAGSADQPVFLGHRFPVKITAIV